tara:strand:+ start:221 stop:763 length:543 start_codon:yes stop_codon:yes gene_type:complete
LNATWHQLWTALEAAVSDASHPLRVGALATCDADGPSVRSVVLRAVDRSAPRLIAYTDRRSAKVGSIGMRPRVEWMFYDASAGMQLRLAGSASVDTDGAGVESAWAGLHDGQRREYALAVNPGARIDPGSAIATVEDARSHFALLRVDVCSVDYLELGRIVHHRVRFEQHRDWVPETLAP